MVPCHHIPLDQRGNTIAKMYRKDTQNDLDQLYHDRLRDLTREVEKQ
jgi:hypothetical protein